MHADLVRKYIELQTILLSPICSHLCEHIWRKLLKHKESIFKGTWPSKVEAVDQKILAEGTYSYRSLKYVPFPFPPFFFSFPLAQLN